LHVKTRKRKVPKKIFDVFAED